jgi:hypothetical protein
LAFHDVAPEHLYYGRSFLEVTADQHGRALSVVDLKPGDDAMNTSFSQVELTKRQKSWPTAEAKSCFLPEGTLTSGDGKKVTQN